MRRNKPILTYKGISVYESFKGREALTYWYALVPNHQAEGHGSFPDMSILPGGYNPGLRISSPSRAVWDGRIFDVRALPRKYTAGLLVEDRSKFRASGDAIFDICRAERAAHLEAIRRAIDDDFDLGSGRTKHPGNALSRWISSLLGSKT